MSEIGQGTALGGTRDIRAMESPLVKQEFYLKVAVLCPVFVFKGVNFCYRGDCVKTRGARRVSVFGLMPADSFF